MRPKLGFQILNENIFPFMNNLSMKSRNWVIGEPEIILAFHSSKTKLIFRSIRVKYQNPGQSWEFFFIHLHHHPRSLLIYFYMSKKVPLFLKDYTHWVYLFTYFTSNLFKVIVNETLMLSSLSLLRHPLFQATQMQRVLLGTFTEGKKGVSVRLGLITNSTNKIFDFILLKVIRILTLHLILTTVTQIVKVNELIFKIFELLTIFWAFLGFCGFLVLKIHFCKCFCIF